MAYINRKGDEGFSLDDLRDLCDVLIAGELLQGILDADEDETDEDDCDCCEVDKNDEKLLAELKKLEDRWNDILEELGVDDDDEIDDEDDFDFDDDDFDFKVGFVEDHALKQMREELYGDEPEFAPESKSIIKKHNGDLVVWGLFDEDIILPHSIPDIKKISVVDGKSITIFWEDDTVTRAEVCGDDV